LLMDLFDLYQVVLTHDCGRHWELETEVNRRYSSVITLLKTKRQRAAKLWFERTLHEVERI